MSTAPVLPLMTVEEYDKLPDPVGGFEYELHFGELVKVGRPSKGHNSLQHSIFRVLTRKLNPALWEVRMEMPYGLAPTYDARATDVGVISRELWDAIPEDRFPIGSPALVVEIKSPSNRDRAMEQDAILHLTHGACAVLIVKEVARQIVLVTTSSRTLHGLGDTITLPAPLSIVIAVDEIFNRTRS